MNMTCWHCGLAIPVDDTGCITCGLCATCTPDAGRCLDCADMRREDLAERAWRYAIENEVTC